jgi:hypothetical protein
VPTIHWQSRDTRGTFGRPWEARQLWVSCMKASDA